MLGWFRKRVILIYLNTFYSTFSLRILSLFSTFSEQMNPERFSTARNT